VLIVKLTRWFAPFSVLFCLVCLLPALLCLGAALCLLVLDGPRHWLGKLYASDLFGACAGAVLAVPLMHWVPTPELVAALGLLPLAAYLLTQPGGRLRVAVLAAAELGLLLVRAPLHLTQTKNYDEKWSGYRPIYERWTPYARITVFDRVFWRPSPVGFGWGFGLHPRVAPAPEQYWLEQDGSAGTPITRLSGSPAELGYLLEDVTAVGYALRPAHDVAVVGAGGGRDILTALASGARRVDAIELNRAIVEAVRGPFGEFSGHVYDLAGVEAIVGEGRSVLGRSRKSYDLIQIALVDSWAATAAGAYALAENGLYTLEAYRLYWSRLSPTGLVSTSRWMAGSSGLEIPRLLLLVRAALDAEGVHEPNAHLALVQGGEVGTVLVSRRPWDEAERTRLADISARLGFVLHWPRVGGSASPDFVRRILAEGPALYRPLGLSLDPPTDDRPFFFQMTSPWHGLDSRVARATGLTTQPVVALRTLMAVVSVLGLALFLGPFALGRRLVRGPGFWRGSAYFASLGLGFMLVEVAWVERSILYLGNASLATATVLGALLAGAGLGSWLSPRISPGVARRLGWLLPTMVLAVNVAFASLAARSWGAPDWVRIGLVSGLLGPVGVLLGSAFPVGMTSFGGERRAWFWAINGAAGVVAGVVSLALAMDLGYFRVATLGAAAYGVAWMLLLFCRASSATCASA
jgi:spermidine synthase